MFHGWVGAKYDGVAGKGKVISVIRKGVKGTIKRTKEGIVYGDCSIGDNGNDDIVVGKMVSTEAMASHKAKIRARRAAV